MAYNEAANKAAQKYKKDNIKRVPLDMQITEYDEVKAAADRAGEKVNQYIKEAIRQRMSREGAGGVSHILPEQSDKVSE